MTLSQLARTSRDIAALPDERLSFSALIRRIMGSLKSSVPCDTINMGTIDLTSELGFHYALDGFLMPAERRDLLPRFKHQNPMIEYARQNGTNPPLRFTDFTSRRQFEERPIYRECYRGYTYSMITFGIEAPSGLSTSFVLSRQSGEFSDSEQEQLTILQPLVSNVVHRRMLKECLAASHENETRVGIVHGNGDYIHTLDTIAQSLIVRYFGRISLHALPDALQKRVSNPQFKFPETWSADGSACLHTRVSQSGDGWTLHLWEEGERLPAAALSKFGFTGRQIEVIRWMELGKTNPEIATILGISYRTVQKHLENIYTSLGVETRIAAINRCREIAK